MTVDKRLIDLLMGKPSENPYAGALPVEPPDYSFGSAFGNYGAITVTVLDCTPSVRHANFCDRLFFILGLGVLG